jgi:tetratricopeptide (TPR) repeat protein
VTPVHVRSPFSATAKIRRLVYRAEVALRRASYAEAEASVREALQRLGYPSAAISTAALSDPDLLVYALEVLACVRRDLTDFTEAATLHQEALAVLEARPPALGNDRLTIVVLDRLGESLRLLGRYSEAEKHCRAAVAVADGLRPPQALYQAEALNGLGIVMKDTQRFREAAYLYHQALDLIVEQLGPDAPRLAGLYHNLAGLEHAQDRFAEGEPFIRRGLELRAMTEEPTSVGTAGDLAVLGALFLGQDRWPEAEEVLLRSLAIWEYHFGPRHYEVAVVQHNLAALYTARGDRQQAKHAYQHVLSIKRDVLGSSHPEVTGLQHHVDQLG